MKRTSLLLMTALVSSKLYAQDSLDGSFTGTEYDTYIINWDFTEGKDAALRLETKKRFSTGYQAYQSWNIFNDHEDASLYFSFSDATDGRDIGKRLVTLTTSGQLGIGITTPDNKLDVKGGIDINDWIRHNGDENTMFGFGGNDQFYIKTNNADRMYINVHGEMGIGTISPGNKLDVNGGIDINDYIRHNGDENTYLGFGGKDQFRIRTNNLDRLYINSSGSIGVGTTNPGNKLDVAGGIDINDYIRHNGDEDTFLGFGGNDQFRIRTKNADRLFVNSSGNIGIGTSDPVHLLEINGTLHSKDYTIEGTSPRLKIGSLGGPADKSRIEFWEGEAGSDPSKALFAIQYDSDVNTLNFMGKSYVGNPSVSAVSDDHLLTIQRDQGKVGIGTSTPDQKLSVIGRIHASSSESHEAIEYIQLWHTSQEGNISTSSGELRIRKGETDYLSFMVTPDGSMINSHTSNLILGTDGGSGLEIDQHGDVNIKNDLKMTGQFQLDTEFVQEDAQSDQILNLKPDGTIAYRFAETLTPWVVREILNADNMIDHVVTCDPGLGLDCDCQTIINAQLGLYDLNGNIKIGEGAYLDNDLHPGTQDAPDDWIRINSSIQVSSSDEMKGLVLRDFDMQQDHFFNLHQKNGISYFSNSNSSQAPEDNHFMRAGSDNSVSFPGGVSMPEFSTNTLSSSGDLLLILDSDESADDGALRIGSGDPEDGASWNEYFTLTSEGEATIYRNADFLQDLEVTGNLNILGSSNVNTGTYGSARDWKEAFDSRMLANHGLSWDPITKNLDVKLGDGLHINENGEIATGFVEDAPNNLSYNGSLAIGTTSHSTYALAVAGEIGAEELVIQLEEEWPDYVFNKGYELATLEETAAFIAKYKHLPDIPSADEVLHNGLRVGEMEVSLLKKIEELTLHLIEKNQEIAALRSAFDRIEQRLIQLENE